MLHGRVNIGAVQYDPSGNVIVDADGNPVNFPDPTASVTPSQSIASDVKAWLGVVQSALPTANQLSNIMRGNPTPTVSYGYVPTQASMFSGLNSLFTPTNMVLAAVGVGIFMYMKSKKR